MGKLVAFFRSEGAAMGAAGDANLWETEETAVHYLREHLACSPRAPIPMILTCPCCGGRHIDEGEFATKVHHTHSCQHCGITWRPAVVPTVGVQFLPGFKNDPASAIEARRAETHSGSVEDESAASEAGDAQ